MSDVEFYVRSLTKRRLGEAYVHLKCRLDRLEPELARLRRMADAYARERLFVDVHMYTGDFIYGCKECGRITDEDRKHTATCDVAIHLGLPREKGEGE